MFDHPKIMAVDSGHPDHALIQKAGKILTQNKVVIFPAKCLYGVAAHAMNPVAVETVFRIKARPLDNPLLVLVRDLAMIKTLVADIPKPAYDLMAAFWPGNLTLVFKAKSHISDRLTAGTGKIGIRIPFHPVARALVNAVDFPITGTSANRSGEPGCTQVSHLPESMIDQAGMVLDAGPVKGGKGSTIADVTQNPVAVLREGEVSIQQIRQTIGRQFCAG